MPRRTTLSLCLFAFAASLAHAADPLDAVFSHIDNAAKTFKGMTADVTNTEHSALADSDEVKTGAFKLLRSKDGTRMLLQLKNAQSASIDPREVKLYTPKTKTVDVWNLANKQGELNQYLLLGFGATSAELSSTYDITWVGDEKISNQSTSHLKLIPKSPDTRRHLKQADLWFGTNGLILQQKLLWPAGDYRMVTYSGMSLGTPSEKDLQLPLPKDVTVQKH